MDFRIPLSEKLSNQYTSFPKAIALFGSIPGSHLLAVTLIITVFLPLAAVHQVIMMLPSTRSSRQITSFDR